MRALADPSTVRSHGWAPEWASVILDSYSTQGDSSPVNARAALARQETRAKDMGYEPRIALEFEFGIFHRDEALLAAGRYRDLRPWGQGLINYSITRGPEQQRFFATLMDRLASIDIGLSAVTTEYGHGMYEFALTPKPPLAAADDAARARLVLQELCLEHGLIATFMARFQPPGRESACGGHHHQSLWRDGKNIFAGEPGELSEAGKQYLAGLLTHLSDTHLVFRPTINSYRRFERTAWSPVEASWGFENRTCSIRAITMPDDNAVRFEHRVPGADINPYLSITAMLAAGLDGIERSLALDDFAPGPLPPTLALSLEAFAESAFVERTFGAELRDHYAASRQFEISAFDRWMAAHITDFEFQRYFPMT
jgi:glutamine synthetase